MYCNRKGRSELIWFSLAHFLMHHGSIPGTVALRAGSSSSGPVFSHTASVLDKSVVVCGGASGAFAVNVKIVVEWVEHIMWCVEGRPVVLGKRRFWEAPRDPGR